MEEEIWKDILGYEGKYQVSNFGNVKSFMRDKKGKLLVPGKSGKYRNYYHVNLNGKGVKVHRLVATAFIPNPDNLPLVNHKDENGLNNSVDNLEWCDNKYNVNYGTCQERHSKRNKELGLFVGEKNPMYGKRGKLNPAHREVLMYSLDGKFIKEFECVTYATLETGVNINDILSCCNNKKVRRAGNYIWRFKEDIVIEEIEPYKHPGERSVLQYSKNGELLMEFGSIKEASKVTGISRMTIGLCCNGKIKTSGGYIWRHKDSDKCDMKIIEKNNNVFVDSNHKRGWLGNYTWFRKKFKSRKSNDPNQLELKFG